VSGEGQSGLAKRVAALASDFALTKDSPFIYMRTMPRLLDPQEVGDFIEALFVECSHRLDETGIKVIAFDTFNRALVGGNENDGRDVGRLLHADERIKRAFSCATIYAHHPGKAEGNDTRGHSSLRGDIDVTAIFSGKSGTRTIEIKKQKDEEDGAIFAY
jgi:RecA-family ATPase